MKKQDFVEHVSNRIVDVTAARDALIAKRADVTVNSDEYKALSDQISHAESRIAFLSMLQTDECASIASAIKLSKEQLVAVESDAKALAKVSELFAALKQSRKLSFSFDDALAQAVAYLIATDFADVSNDELRKQIKSKRSDYTEAHTTTRQADMILNMFERLNVCSTTRETRSAELKASKANVLRRFDVDSEIVKRLNAIYA